MSRNGLRTVAIRSGIISEAIGEGREKNLLDAAKFGEWVVKVARKPPANCNHFQGTGLEQYPCF